MSIIVRRRLNANALVLACPPYDEREHLPGPQQPSITSTRKCVYRCVLRTTGCSHASQDGSLGFSLALFPQSGSGLVQSSHWQPGPDG